MTAAAYGFPADLGDAPRAWMRNQGWAARRVMKRWPTVPVAPRTPILTECIGEDGGVEQRVEQN